jgi:hypothetical protein
MKQIDVTLLCADCQEKIRKMKAEYMRSYRSVPRAPRSKPLKEKTVPVIEQKDEIPPPPILEEDGEEIVPPKIDPWAQKQAEWLKKGLCKHGKKECSMC